MERRWGGLSRVVDVKYGYFAPFLAIIKRALERLCACQTERTCQGQTRGYRDKGSIVLLWFFCNEQCEDAQEQVPTQVPNHDKFVDAQTTTGRPHNQCM